MTRTDNSSASFHQVSTNDLVARAAALGPLLKKNAVQSEKDRRAHQENIAALDAAGLFRMMVPKRLGGFQSSIRTHLEVTSTLAESCGGTAWVAALMNSCAWFVSLYSEKTQKEVFESAPDARVSGVFMPSKDCQRVDGGLLASGKWYWASGSLHADWVIVGIAEHDEHGTFVGQYLALLPKKDITVEDTWFTVGMRPSGSNCIVAKDVFIPNHRLLNISAAINGDYPTEFKDEAEYRAAFVPVAVLILVGPQLGLGRAALKHVVDNASERAIAYTSYGKQSDSVTFQMQIAQAATKIDSAHLHAYRAAADIDAAAQRGEKMDYLTRARVRADAGHVVTCITDAINILISAHGAGTFSEGNPLQAIWRDANTAARHAVVLPEIGMEIYGKAILGVENNITPLV